MKDGQRDQICSENGTRLIPVFVEFHEFFCENDAVFSDYVVLPAYFCLLVFEARGDFCALVFLSFRNSGNSFNPVFVVLQQIASDPTGNSTFAIVQKNSGRLTIF